MGKMQEFGAMAAKIRAMRSRLLTEEDYRNLSAQKTMGGVLEALETFPAYADILNRIPDSSADRITVEGELRLSEYADFRKLYRFANLRERAFLRVYGARYESLIVKRCLRHAFSGDEALAEIYCPRQIMRVFSGLDFNRLIAARSPEDFAKALKGSDYETPVRRLLDAGNHRIGDYETAIDLTRLGRMWDRRKNGLPGEDEAILHETLGAIVDIQNILWIYRMKKYYSMTPDEIRNVLVPFQYRLRPSSLKEMAEAPDMAAFYAALGRSRYGKILPRPESDSAGPEDLWQKAVDDIFRQNARDHYYSIACLNTYLYEKGREINKIITVLEKIRYGKGGAGS